MFAVICVLNGKALKTHVKIQLLKCTCYSVWIGPFPAETSSLSAYGLKDEGCQDALTNRIVIM